MKFKDIKKKIDRARGKVTSKFDRVTGQMGKLEEKIDQFSDPRAFIDKQKNELLDKAFKKITGLSIDNPTIAVKKYEVDTTPVTLQYPNIAIENAPFLEFRIMERNAVGDNIRRAIESKPANESFGLRDLSKVVSKDQVTEGVDYNKTIKLFVPSGALDTTYDLVYNEKERGIVTKIISDMKAGKGLGEAASGALVQGAAKKLVDTETSAGIFGQFGLARNPNMEILFSRPGFRSFSFNFAFIPRNERESETIKKIVKMFKEYAHPEPIASDKSNAFWKFPDVFEIKLNNELDLTGEKIPFKTKKCVLKNIKVTYENSDGSFGQLKDGHATTINLSLSFDEIITLTRKDIQDGY